MSKYKSVYYAKALVDAMGHKKISEKKLITNFLNLLQKNQDVKKIGEIILLAENLLLKKTGNKKIVFETAREVNLESFDSYIKKGDIVEERINTDLVAGVKITINGEKQLDLSLKNKLDLLFNKAIK